MGLIGIFIAVGMMALGVGFLFFSMTSSSLTIENDALPTTGLALYEDLKTEATELVETEEMRVEQEIVALEEALVAKKASEPSIPVAPAEKKETAESVNKIAITNRLMDSGFAVSAKARSIDTIVLHSSYNPNGGDAYGVSELVKIYESYGVSAHYLIDRGGKIYRLVEDNNIAYHAGASKMPDGRQNVNTFSIGIEIMNKEDTEFTKAQYEAVNNLIAFLKEEHGIKNVVGHGDIAPTRKTDPWNFDWKKLR